MLQDQSSKEVVERIRLLLRDFEFWRLGGILWGG